MTKKEKDELKKYVPLKKYINRSSYLYIIKYCPGYEGYKPKNLDCEVCKYCGNISYYHIN
jgi:hypothetical protein